MVKEVIYGETFIYVHKFIYCEKFIYGEQVHLWWQSKFFLSKSLFMVMKYIYGIQIVNLLILNCVAYNAFCVFTPFWNLTNISLCLCYKFMFMLSNQWRVNECKMALLTKCIQGLQIDYKFNSKTKLTTFWYNLMFTSTNICTRNNHIKLNKVYPNWIVCLTHSTSELITGRTNDAHMQTSNLIQSSKYFPVYSEKTNNAQTNVTCHRRSINHQRCNARQPPPQPPATTKVSRCQTFRLVKTFTIL